MRIASSYDESIAPRTRLAVYGKSELNGRKMVFVGVPSET